MDINNTENSICFFFLLFFSTRLAQEKKASGRRLQPLIMGYSRRKFSHINSRECLVKKSVSALPVLTRMRQQQSLCERCVVSAAALPGWSAREKGCDAESFSVYGIVEDYR